MTPSEAREILNHQRPRPFDAISTADNPYSRARNELARLRKALGKAEAAMPFEKLNYLTDPKTISPRGQAMLAAGGSYLKLLLKHWDAGVSPEDLAAVAATVDKLNPTQAAPAPKPSQ